ncbi:MAG: hypothetical protein LUF80_01245 [Oscillospiraceae bacterium]|nr:hypothetical protein [Oscillospiraceae bacterium]
MNRTELIEMIYALQQSERTLREENLWLHKQVDDKRLRLDKAGSIAEAALSLNHIFEDAQAAAQQYLDSIQYTEQNAAQTLAQAQQQADEMLRQAQTEVDVAAIRIQQAEERCRALREQTDREVRQQREAFLSTARAALSKYSELTAHFEVAGEETPASGQ